MLHNIQLSGTQMPTMTMRNDTYKVNASSIDQTKPVTENSGGNTITISKHNDISNTKPGETVVIPPEKSYLRSISKPQDAFNQIVDNKEASDEQIHDNKEDSANNKEASSNNKEASAEQIRETETPNENNQKNPAAKMQTTPKTKTAWGKGDFFV